MVVDEEAALAVDADRCPEHTTFRFRGHDALILLDSVHVKSFAPLDRAAPSEILGIRFRRTKVGSLRSHLLPSVSSRRPGWRWSSKESSLKKLSFVTSKHNQRFCINCS